LSNERADNTLDFRSDTVTQPTEAMRDATDVIKEALSL
jgi:threonine aldolase